MIANKNDYNINSQMISKSPMKIKEWKEYIHTEKLPFGLLVYSYADK